MIYIFIRKMRSLAIILSRAIVNNLHYLRIVGNPAIKIDRRCLFGRSVKLIATDGGVISMGSGASLGDYVQLIVQGGKLTIEDNVFVGTGSIIVCREKIFIGQDTLIAEYVVIRDQDHSTETRPIRKSGFHISPIKIGRDVWIGCKATILRGANVGDHCVIGAHALVKSTIPNGMLAVGVPARVVKRIESGQ